MIRTKHIVDMVNHWMNTRPNGYFGSSYGAPLESLLLTAMTSDKADAFIAKMKEDIPILKQLSSDQFAIYSENSGFEKKIFYLKIGTISINLSTAASSSSLNSGETSSVDAS